MNVLNKAKSVVFNLIVIVASIALIVLGFVISSNVKKGYKAHTAETKATVVSYDESEVEETDDDGFTKTVTHYFPVIEYTVDGKDYKSTYNFGSSKKEYDIDSEVDILYNPDKPKDYHFKNDKSADFLSFVPIAIGCIGLVIEFVNLKRKIF